jgi:hypothetical protein
MSRILYFMHHIALCTSCIAHFEMLRKIVRIGVDVGFGSRRVVERQLVSDRCFISTFHFMLC